MCLYGAADHIERKREPRALSAEEAAVAMVRLISQNCRVDIHPDDLLAMFAAHGSKLSALAHAIHEDMH